MKPSVAYGLFGALMVVIGGLTSLAILRSHGVDVWPWNREPHRFEGIYTLGFETSEFIPCGPSETGTRYWLTFSPNAELSDSLAKMGTGRGFSAARVVLVGELETRPGGGYGHLGAYGGQVVVDRFISVEPERACD